MNWDYLQPVKIRFGKGRVSELKTAYWLQTHSSLQTVWQSAL